ncbi:hypothetical protein [Amycolatopsis sp. YIM 10]|uniref:hypothetical protein n=1 Tax=Amycolatopsis sp. YIM 10 TaxID=2653857 RepID=UPI0012900939|nr:hypothetical protein [Amycolatopsis sp. YIM 10]QFU92927.1 Isoniazid-induced protein IniC [Amycolatopsis sp. YIM 10]
MIAEAAGELLQRALSLYQDSARATSWLDRHLARFAEPLRLAVAGPAETGKSSLLNALAGDEVAPLKIGDRQVVTWYQGGSAPRALAYPPGGAAPWEMGAERAERRLRVDLAPLGGQQVDRLVVDWPSRQLRDVVLMDTPALDPEAGPQALAGGLTDADALLYLVRRPHGPELDVLRTLHGPPSGWAPPVHTMVVLSRADELGAGRVDALISARQVARRYRRTDEVQDLSQDVVAVAGLVASAGRTLGEPEFAALSALAQVPRPELESRLLSADRFVRADAPLPLKPGAREWLLGRFGLFGLRLATTLIRRGANTVPALAGQLVQRSGLGELRDAIAQQFTAREDVLKARAALLGLEVLLRREPRPGSEQLAAELDRLVSGAHAFAELRVLAALRGGRTELPEELAEDAIRLTGGQGVGLLERLGIEEEVSPAEVQEAIQDALWHWREQAVNPALSGVARRAAEVVLRSCEAMLARDPAYAQ